MYRAADQRHRVGWERSNLKKDDQSFYSRNEPQQQSFRGLGYGIPNFVGIVFFILSLVYAVNITENFLPDPKPVSSSPTEFSADAAAKHLFDITKLGPRTAGSYANDISAVNIIVEALNKIKHKADMGFEVEIDVQTETSGTFAFVRSGLIDIGYTIAYNNITNVVAKLSNKKHESNSYILVNAHFDTVSNTVGASDDTVSCAVMLEILRALTKGNPENLKHGVIFLFNGAEEGPLAGSHAFINQHKWKDLPSIVVNLEAAGSGGREFVFQTGPNHPWILDTYAKAAKYPFTSVVAQEVFQAGVIPSDTDFRVFVQYGSLVGIDLAFISNGYVYHTKYDNANSIPKGSIQRAGDNVLGVLEALVSSPYLDNPEQYRHGSSVFFDLLGSFIIRYPKRLHLLMNNITCAVVVLYFLQRMVRKKLSSNKEHVGLRHSTDHMTIGSVMIAAVIIVLAWLVAFVFAFGTAFMLVKLQALNVWYSRPSFGLLLYGLPALFGMLLSHFVGNSVMKTISNPSLPSFIYAHLLVDTILLCYLNTKELMSSFILWFWVISPFLILAVGYDYIPFLPEKKSMGIFCLHILGSSFPTLLTIYHGNVFFIFFGPLLGRTGTEMPGDYVIAGLSAFLVVIVCTYYMNIYQHANNMRRFLIFIGIISCLPIMYVLTGRMQPYSASNPIAPKRLFQIHMSRTFYDASKQVVKDDSGLLIQPMDYIGFSPLKDIPFYKDAKPFFCDGVYCGLPYFYAMRKIIRNPYILAGPPHAISSALGGDVYTKKQTSLTTVRYYFNVPVDGYGNLYITEKDGIILSDWSLYKTDEGHIYKMDDYLGEGKQVYFSLYSSGYYSTNWKFWIEFQLPKPSWTGDIADVAISRHHLQLPGTKTNLIEQSRKALPSWICDNSWSSNYDHFTLG